MHANPSCTIQMTEWICWYKSFGIQRGESYQKVFLEEWEKVDPEQSYVCGEDKSCPTAIVTETERLQKAQEDGRTTTREPHRGGCSLPKSSWEAVGAFDAPSWKYTGTQGSTVSWGSLAAALKCSRSPFIDPRQVGTFPKRLALPYPCDEILSGWFFGLGEDGP